VTGTTTRPEEELRVANTVEVRGDNLLVNVRGRDKASMFVPTMTIPLDHVLGPRPIRRSSAGCGGRGSSGGMVGTAPPSLG